MKQRTQVFARSGGTAPSHGPLSWEGFKAKTSPAPAGAFWRRVFFIGENGLELSIAANFRKKGKLKVTLSAKNFESSGLNRQRLESR